MAENKNISRELLPEPTLRRLPWYLAYVSMLHSQNVEYVSSTQISKELNVDSSQIAKDLSFLNIKGKTRIGYEVAKLERELRDFLGFKRHHNAVMMGVGSLGAALIQDSGLSRYGLNIVAGFDVNPLIVGTSICGVPIYNVDELNTRRKEYNAEIGIVAVPVDKAQEVAEKMIAAGIKAIWNFTPVRIRATEDVVIQDTSIYSHLAVMYNRLDAQNTKVK
ncbi:MAG: redox-sensing transcriptional repressor Rex [Muribaculaceae bacterium]|nr:redox-sensing transcriptional repressor Rex [Muribaculaceae bacterium]MBR1964039.1 redox-sensing transcriptional repressor Rex [Muribaculaceae bacterium]